MASDPSQPIIVALISALGGVLAAAFAAVVSLARREGGDASRGRPPLDERVAVLERRADDADEALNLLDRRADREEVRMEDGQRRLSRVEKMLDGRNPTDRRD